MFGTEIHISTFIFMVIQAVIFIPALLNWMRSPKEKDRIRYLIVVSLFFLYNLASGLIPDEKLGVNRIAQDIIAYTVGITCAVYFLYYLYSDFKIKPIQYLRINTVLNILVLDFLFLFIIPYTITQNLKTARNIFLIIPILLGISTLSNIYYYLYRDFYKERNWYYKTRIFFGAIAMLSLISLPLNIVIFGDNQPIEHTSFNIGFIAVTVSYIFRIFYLSKIDIQIEDKIDNSIKNEIQLNDKEKEIIYLILTNPNKTYEELINQYFKETKLQSLKSRLYKVLNHLEDDELLSLHKVEYNILKVFKKHQFSEREIEVASLILKGEKYKDIGEKMFITEKTISKHASNIFKKVSVKNKSDFKNFFKDL